MATAEDAETVGAALWDCEQVVFCSDPASGLRAVVAVHSTALGPALGGTRLLPYASEAAAVADVLRLARAMTAKAAVAGLDCGGGKAVVLAPPDLPATGPVRERLLRAYGRALHGLGGRYRTACDVGTSPADMDVIALETPHVTGRTPAAGGSGDSGRLTALGVHAALRSAAEHAFGTPSLAGRRVAVEGVGKVGARLVGHLLAEGADVVVSDVDDVAVAALQAQAPLHPRGGGVERLDVADLPSADVDVLAPCALGGTLTADLVPRLRARVVCGGANNQLADPAVADALAAAGVLYVPDFVANAGGLVQVADEATGRYDEERATSRVLQIGATVTRVLQAAEESGTTPARAADALAAARVAEADRRRRAGEHPGTSEDEVFPRSR